MEKKSQDILDTIIKNKKKMTPGELILSLRIRSNKELKRFNENIKYLVKYNYLRRNKDGSLNVVKNLSNKNNSEKPKKVNKKNIEVKNYSLLSTDDTKRIIEEFKLPHIIPPFIEEEAHNFLNNFVLENEIKYRKNYSNLFTITIDGEHAKDLDDAFSLYKDKENTVLIVHIADVSFYVHEDSKLDQTAYKRGNSVYLINKVIPMLPEILSNNYCSLNPDEIKLTLSCEITLSSTGTILSYQFTQGYIKSNYRLTYNYVEDVLNNKVGTNDKELSKMLVDAQKLTHILKQKRLKEGSLDFNLPEIEVICNEEGIPTHFEKQKRLFAHTIIEEFMLTANQAAATLLWKHKTGIFRIHEKPAIEKLQHFYKTMQSMEIPMRHFRNIQDMQIFLEQPRSPYLQAFINQLLVQSMSQAQYSSNNIGHFGLGFPLYTHFTSPIRRYSDLIVHRQIKSLLKIAPTKHALKKVYLSKVSKHISDTERLAIKAERKLVKLKSIRFLENYPKDLAIPAHVFSIQEYGIFVQLEHTLIEGLIPTRSLVGWVYLEKINSFQNKSSKTILKVGQPIMVNIDKLNLEKILIDFSLTSVLED